MVKKSSTMFSLLNSVESQSPDEVKKWIKVASSLLHPGKKEWKLPDIQIQRSRSQFKKQLFAFCHDYEACLLNQHIRKLVYSTIRNCCKSKERKEEYKKRKLAAQEPNQVVSVPATQAT